MQPGFLAGRQGFEPRYRGPESGLPMSVRVGPLRFLRFFAPVVRSAPFRFATFVCSVSHCVSGSGVASSAPVKCSGHTFMPACRTAFQSCMANVATTISVPTDSCHVSADAS
jgi:hypothetical protein